MRLAIVGHEAAKFTPQAQAQARAAIIEEIEQRGAVLVVSGRSPLGGVDIWAIEEAKRLGRAYQEFPPTTRQWDGPGGYKERNLQIAANCDHCLVVVVRELPPTYKGMRFNGCYHCDKPNRFHEAHVKSGGCWTAWRAPSRSWVIL